MKIMPILTLLLFISGCELPKDKEYKEIITLKEICKECQANPISFEDKYYNHFIFVKGKIANINYNGFGTYSITLKEESFGEIHCEMLNKEEIVKIKNGDNILLRGKFEKLYLKDSLLLLEDCKVIEIIKGE